MVYQKSALGVHEFIAKDRTLNVRERQVLLLINGRRDLVELEKFFKQPFLDETIKKLSVTGYIQLVNMRQSAHEPQLDSQTPNITSLSFINHDVFTQDIGVDQLKTVQHILLESCDDFLGLMGRSLKDKIEKCHNRADLQACISSWHMAMRESKLGRESTDFLITQIHQTLEHRA